MTLQRDHALPREEDLDTRARIVRVAETLFHRYGYQKTTVADIARELQMSPANVYRFFAAKKDINEAVALRLTTEVEAAIRAMIDGPGTATEKLRAYVLMTHRMNAERYVDDVKMHEMVAVAMSESWPLIEGHIRRMHALLTEIIEQGIASGEFATPDPAVAAHCVKAATMRFCHPKLMVECANVTEPTIDQMIDFALAGLGCRS
ncbi:MAG: TetR family transcriptional regulator [Hyphomicrobiales bacterium]